VFDTTSALGTTALAPGRPQGGGGIEHPPVISHPPGPAAESPGAARHDPSVRRPAAEWPVFVPFVGTGGIGREPWYLDFLTHLSANGGRRLAAADAGISQKQLATALAIDPVFAAEVEAAEGFYRDLLEWESVNLARTRNNPLPYFARLKAELPARYIDKAVNLNVNATATDPTAAEARELLARAFSDGALTPSTQRELRKLGVALPAPLEGAQEP
jgi:hypothetical protein